jgi:hypothetical protein
MEAVSTTEHLEVISMAASPGSAFWVSLSRQTVILEASQLKDVSGTRPRKQPIEEK